MDDLCNMFEVSNLICPESNWSELISGYQATCDLLENGHTLTLEYADTTSRRYRVYLSFLSLESGLSNALHAFLAMPNLYVAYYIDSEVMKRLEDE